MLLRNALPLLTLWILCACPLSATGIDPYSLDNFPDPGPGLGLVFAASGPICFPEGQNTECFDNLTLSASTVNDAYDFGQNAYELDSITGLMNAEFYLNGVDEGDWIVPYEDTTVFDRTLGTFGTDIFDMLDFETLGGGSFPEMELRWDPDQTNPGGSATITQASPGYQITSFFDVFTDLSLDGGNTWTPSNVAPETLFNLVSAPEPGSLALALIGLVSLATRLRRRVTPRS